MAVLNFLQHVAQGDNKPGGGVFGFLRQNVVEPIVNPGFKFLNEVAATGGLATGGEKGAEDILNPGGGFGHQGGVVSPYSTNAATNLKKIVGTGASIGSNLVIPGAGGTTGNLGLKVAKGAAFGAGAGTIGNAGQQLADTGRIDPKQLVLGTLSGAVLGGGAPLVGAAARGVAAHNVLVPALDEGGSIGPHVPGQPFKPTPEQLDALAKASTASEAAKPLAQDLAPNVTNRIAPAIAQTTDKNVIPNIINRESSKTAEPTIADLQAVHNSRPNATIQTAIEQAHNAGDNVTVEKLVNQLPAGDQNAMRSALGMPPGNLANNKDFVYQGGLPGTKSEFWATTPGQALAYAQQKGMKNGEIRIAKWGDIPADFKDIPKESLSDFAKRQSYIAVSKNTEVPIVGRIDASRIDPLASSKQILDEYYNQSAAQSVLGKPSIPAVTDQAAMRSALGMPHPAAPTAPQDIISATTPRQAEAPTDPFNQISDILNGRKAENGQAAVKGLNSVSAERGAALSEERGARFKASQTAGQEATGSEGYFKELHALKGEYNRPTFGGMIDNIGPQKAEDLFSATRQQVQNVPDKAYNDIGLHPQSARLNTQTALRKVIFGEGGGVPTASEIKLLKLVSPNLASDIESKIPLHRKLFDLAAKITALPRALQSTLDLSMGGRQGLLVAARHPVEWAKANTESVKYLNPQYFHDAMQTIRARPSFGLAEKYGLAAQAATGLKEEAYASSDLATGKVAKKLLIGHAVEASERAYDGGLTRMRMDLWDKLINQYGGVDQVEGKLGAKGMKDLAEAINTATGRGGKSGGLVEQHMKTLSTTLFSPRLWASRLNTLNPYYYARLSPAARNFALQSAGSFAAVAGVVLSGAAALGAQVETDPRSSDFLKIKVGDTRYDVLGGFQQNLVFAWRELTGEKKNSQTGKVTSLGDGFGAPTRLTLASDLVGNKLNPLFGAGAKILAGKDKSGQPVNPATEIGKLFIPLNLQGAYETTKHANGDGSITPGAIAKGSAMNVPNIFGVGTQTYGLQDLALTGKQQKYVDSLKNKGAPKAQLDASKSFFQTQKSAPDRDSAAKAVKAALQANDLQKANDLTAEYNKQYAETFKPWLAKNDQFKNDPELIKAYQSKKITSDSISRWLVEIDKNNGGTQ